MATKRLCSVEGCDKPHCSNGYCSSHNHRWKRHGDPLKGWKFRSKIPYPCSIEGCNRPASSRGWCNAHYIRWKKYRDPSINRGKGKCLRWLKSHIGYEGDGCLIWPFSRNPKTGMGKVRFQEHHISASRAMCILAHGEPPTPNHQAAHSCGKGHEGCVHPKHLRWALPYQNHQDHLQHGTRKILSLVEKREIRELASHMTHREIGERYGFATSTISHFLRGTRSPKYR